jgi:hypothetical protein
MMMPPIGFFLVMLLFWMVPIVGIALAVRWGIRVRRALENRPPPEPALPPARLQQLEEELQAMSARLDSLEEKQEFMVKLLAPRESSGGAPTEQH